jgi:hypothetical protein
MANKIQLRRGNAAQWVLINPILSGGEAGVEIDTFKVKIGNGFDHWNDLPYCTLNQDDVEALVAVHADRSDNPHSVNASQIGLGNVDNTSDLDKPISTSTQAALDLKLNANSSISSGTKTKITYDSHGLVTAGSDAILDDLGDVVISSPSLNQILKFNGTNWVNGSGATVSPGAALTYYLTKASAGTSPYAQLMSFTPDSGTEEDEVISINNNTVQHHAYIADTAIGKSTIDAGIWEFNIYTYVSNGSARWQFKILKRNTSGNETELFTTTSQSFSNTSVELLTISTVQPAFTCDPTDKLVFRQYGISTDSLSLHFIHSGTDHYSHLHTPLSPSHNDLNGLQGGTANQYFHLTSSEYTGTGTGTFVRATALNAYVPTSRTVNGYPLSSDVSLSKGDVGLGNVPNTDATLRSNHTGTQASSTISDFTEAAQDAIGLALTDTASVDFTYNDSANTISAAVIPAGVDHNSLQNYVANRHVDHSSISVNAGTGLSGGGDLTASRTISMPNVGTSGTHGSSTQIPVITTDAQGRVSNVTTTGISISNNSAIAITTVTTTSTTDTLLNDMTLTPPAGTYLAIFSGSMVNSMNGAQRLFVSIYAAGVQANGSGRSIGIGGGAYANASTQAIVTVTGSQAIEVRWRAAAGTNTAIDRAFNLIKIG